MNLVPVSRPRSWVSPSILAFPMLDLSMKARSLSDCQSPGKVYTEQKSCCVGVVPYSEKEWNNVKVELSVQLPVDGRVDVDVCLFTPQLFNMCLFGLGDIILRAHLRCRRFLRVHRKRSWVWNDTLKDWLSASSLFRANRKPAHKGPRAEKGNYVARKIFTELQEKKNVCDAMTAYSNWSLIPRCFMTLLIASDRLLIDHLKLIADSAIPNQANVWASSLPQNKATAVICGEARRGNGPLAHP